jgi:CheY-like chemotaxis protein
LFAILGNLNLIQDSPLPEEIIHNLKELESAALKARELTRKLISISKGEVPVKKLTRVGESIINTTNMALSDSRIKSHIFLDENLWPSEIDEGQICQAFYNIVINSREALEEEGEIRVETENVVLEKDNASVMPPGKYIRIVFRDEGPGIDKKYLDNIFDPYFSTKQRFTDKGLGLGLTIAHSIVKKHDGNILVDSEVGLGTTCTILLPASDKPLEEEQPVPGQTIAGRGKILVMDDDEMIRRLYSRLLKRLGYECFVAGEGEEAVRMYRESMDTGDVFDAVILDLNVKHGMDGKEAIRELRALDPSIRCILVTSSNEPLPEKYVKKLGFLEALYKPCGIDEISRVLHEVLN